MIFAHVVTAFLILSIVLAFTFLLIFGFSYKKDGALNARNKTLKGLTYFSVYLFVAAVLFVIREVLSGKVSTNIDDILDTFLATICFAIAFIAIGFFLVSHIFIQYRMELLAERIKESKKN